MLQEVAVAGQLVAERVGVNQVRGGQDVRRVQGAFPGLRAARHAVAELVHRAQAGQGRVEQLAVAGKRRRVQQARHRGGGQAIGFIGEMGFAVIRSAGLRMILYGTVGLEVAERLLADLLRTLCGFRHMAVNERGHGIAHVSHAGGIEILRRDRAEGVFGRLLKPLGQGRLAALIRQPVHPDCGIGGRAKLEMVARNRMAEQLPFADLRIEPAAGGQGDVFLQVNVRTRQRGQTAQRNVLFHGGHDTVAHSAEQGGVQDQRLIGAQHLAHAREQAALLAILSIRTGEDQAHHVSPGAEQAVGRVEHSAHVRPRLPSQREVASVVLDGHERESELEVVGHLPLRGRADDVRLRAAWLVVQILQTGEQPLPLRCPEGTGTGEDH